MSKAIETAISREKWKEAGRLVRAELKEKPDRHWLLTRLGLTYYEEPAYRTSLSYSPKKSFPNLCWRPSNARETPHGAPVYGRLLSRGIEKIACGDCGEGRRWACGLIADCRYRRAQSFKTLKRPKEAVSSYRKHLKMRGPGCMSIYPIRIVRKKLSELA